MKISQYSHARQKIPPLHYYHDYGAIGARFCYSWRERFRRLLSELTGELFHRLLAGELDAAAVLLPEGKTAPPPLLTNIIASDRMEIVPSHTKAQLRHTQSELDTFLTRRLND
jgi:hypothetical protein